MDSKKASESVTRRDRVADFFRDHPNRWIDGRQLGTIGGAYAWRTRVSECRVALGMTIKNRVRREDGMVISEYRFVPEAPADLSRAVQRSLEL